MGLFSCKESKQGLFKEKNLSRIFTLMLLLLMV